MDRSDRIADLTPETIAPAFRDHFESLGTRDSKCPEHGPFTSAGKRMFKREFWQRCPECLANEAHQLEEDARRAQAAMIAKQREAAIGEACIPTRFRGLDFDSFVAATPQQELIARHVRRYAETFEQHRQSGAGLVLAGLPGTGKTHLAAAAMLHLVGEPKTWVQYVTCMGLIRMVRDTWRKDSELSEKKVLTMLGERIDLLVIDEVGVQYGTEAEQTVLFEILDRRYAEMRPTILITNQDKEGFKSFIGERVADRLRQTHNWLVFDWPSYRKQARAQ